MKKIQAPIKSLVEAMEVFDVVMTRYPERDGVEPFLSALAGRRRRYSGLTLMHLVSPDDTVPCNDDLVLPEVATPQTPEGNLARDIIAMLEPLKLLNPVCPCFATGQGSESMTPSFGIPLNHEMGDTPAFHKSLDQVLSEPPPDPATSGLLPNVHERIDFIKANVGSRFKIGFPGLQGPFNIAHAVLGPEVFTAPYDDETRFHALMERITTFWIGVRRTLIGWIGEEYMPPAPYAWKPGITECSVNLVSADFYRRFVLPHDLRIVEAFGPVHIHPCSGPHVFHVTLENLPAVATEAGYIARTTAGAISVDDALKAIGKRPIMLAIGQELPEGGEYEFIRRDLDRYAVHRRLTFSYTGMHWRRKDRPCMRDIHRRLDEYWAGKFPPGNCDKKEIS